MELSGQDEQGSGMLNGRVGAIVRWLVEHREEIEGAEKGDLQFHFAGSSIVPRWTELHEPLRVDE